MTYHTIAPNLPHFVRRTNSTPYSVLSNASQLSECIDLIAYANWSDNITGLLSFVLVTALAPAETWLADSQDDLISMRGYQLLSKTRREGRIEGGVLISDQTWDFLSYLRGPFSSFFRILLDFLRKFYKIGWVIVGVLHRTPGLNSDDFFSERDSKQKLLMGELNAHLLKSMNSLSLRMTA